MLSIRQIPIPLSFSLRTLLLAVTALAVWLGYNVSWIHQRHAFLAQQLARHRNTKHSALDRDGRTVPWQPSRDSVDEWWGKQLATAKRAPWCLPLFGEGGVGKLWVVVPASDVTVRIWGYEGLSPVQWREIKSSQPDYRRAKHLFPEAMIRPVAPDEMIIERDGFGMSGWLHPGVTVRNPSRPTILRLVCDSTVFENSVLKGHFELRAPLEGVATINYRTEDGTATTWQGNYDESPDRILAEPGEKTFPFTINIGPLTDDQRAAGGATFSIKLDLVIGAVPAVKEKTITIVPTRQ